MKIKDLIAVLKGYDQEAEVVMGDLYRNPNEPPYVLEKIRAYRLNGRVIIDGYEKRVEHR